MASSSLVDRQCTTIGLLDIPALGIIKTALDGPTRAVKRTNRGTRQTNNAFRRPRKDWDVTAASRSSDQR